MVGTGFFVHDALDAASSELSTDAMADIMIREIEEKDLTVTEFDEKLWRIMVENVTVGLDGEMVFRFRNGMEVTVE